MLTACFAMVPQPVSAAERVKLTASLVAIFNREFDTLMSVVASDIKISVAVPDYVRPVRVLGTDAHIDGRELSIPLTQLYSGQNCYFIVELEVDGRNWT